MTPDERLAAVFAARRPYKSIRTRERHRWKLMLGRCHDPNGLAYRYYGARGIKVCERWHDFETYFADIMRLLGPCPDGKSLDRIDNDGDYEPGNVRWATASQQQQNSRNVLRRAVTSCR